MTAGLPDFYRSVNIAQQGLPQMIVRPKHGGALAASGSVVVTANITTNLATVLGTGMIYGGVVYVDHTASQGSGIPGLITDGSIVAGLSFEVLNRYAIRECRAHALYILKFDDTNFEYSVAIANGITFESQFALVFNEGEGDTPQVNYNIVYALI